MHAMGAPMRSRAQKKWDEHDSRPSVVFTHLFSAPLVEHKRGDGGSGPVLAEKVDELSYQGERETLLKTLADAGKKVRFLSEAANSKSFTRAIGCASGRDRDTPAFGGQRSCQDGECRIMHFTGHGVRGQLTFEDQGGQLQYVDQGGLLAMLQSRGRGQAVPASGTHNCTSSRGSPLASQYAPLPPPIDAPPAAADVYHDPSGSYAQFEDMAVSFEGLEVGEVAEDFVTERASPPRSGLQLVFLSSCHSASVANCFIEAGVRHVIAVKQDAKVLDHKAADFAESFYTSLLRGDTVRQAFSMGSDRLRVSDQPEEGHKFLLLPTDGNHDIPVFEEVTEGQFVDETPQKPLYRCDAVTEHFWGRAVDVQKVVKHMVGGARCVTITGQKGIGKTQVLLKACAYTRERHVFGDIFFCRVDKAGSDNDACHWLEKGFALQVGSLAAHNMDGAVARISKHVQRQFQVLTDGGSCAPRRALLVLDGCARHLMVGQERVELRDLLSRLFMALPNLTAAVTMRATGPATPGWVGVQGEKIVVVEGLDNRSTAELFTKCCPRKLETIEMNPHREALMGQDGKPDTMGVFAKSDLINALRGHPACVQDLCRLVHEERSLLLNKERLLTVDTPKLQKQYEYRDPPSSRWSTNRARPRADPIVPEPMPLDAFHGFWGEVTGTNRGFYESPDGSIAYWGRLCKAIARCFASRVSGARSRPLTQADFELFAEDPALWAGPTPAQMRARYDGDVASVPITPEEFKPFWLWFWQAMVTLRKTGAWVAGQGGAAPGFAGFVKKASVEPLLSGAQPGTFLIRFSTSKPGALAVHYASSRNRGVVKNAVFNVNDRGELTCDVGSGRFRNLDELALKTRQLVFLHPDTPKAMVFSRPQHRNSWTSGPLYGDGSGRGGGGTGSGGARGAGYMSSTSSMSRRQSLPPAMSVL